MCMVNTKRPVYKTKEKSLARNTSGESLIRNTSNTSASGGSLTRNTSEESLHNQLINGSSRSSPGLSMVNFRNFMQIVRVNSPESIEESTCNKNLKNVITVQSEELASPKENITKRSTEMKKKFIMKAR